MNPYQDGYAAAQAAHSGEVSEMEALRRAVKYKNQSDVDLWSEGWNDFMQEVRNG